MGSRSDWETMRHAAETLERWGSPTRSRSSRRTGRPIGYSVRRARPRARGLQLLIAGAGARRTCRGCSRRSRSCRSWASRSRARSCGGSIRCCRSSRCPRASPSAPSPSAPSGAANAALLAAAILARHDPASAQALAAYRQAQTEAVGEAPVDRTDRAVLLPPATLGVIGGGPARPDVPPGRAADGLPDRASSAPRPTPPPRRSRHAAIVAPPDHLPALRALAEQADAVTVEFENVSAPALRWLARSASRSGPAGGRSG